MKKFNWHSLLMILCCLIPLVAIIYFLNPGRVSTGGWGFWLFLLICPLMHIMMMKFMPGGNCHNDKETSKGTAQEQPVAKQSKLFENQE